LVRVQHHLHRIAIRVEERNRNLVDQEVHSLSPNLMSLIKSLVIGNDEK
jgi:hypothetical protein